MFLLSYNLTIEQSINIKDEKQFRDSLQQITTQWSLTSDNPTESLILFEPRRLLGSDYTISISI